VVTAVAWKAITNERRYVGSNPALGVPHGDNMTNEDDNVIIRANIHGDVCVWGKKKDWNRLMDFGKEIGISDDDALRAYDIALQQAYATGDPTDFESLFTDVRKGLRMHFETVNATNLIASEFNMDPQEVYNLYQELLFTGKCKDKIINLPCTEDDPTPLVKAVAEVTREWIIKNKQT
jgi:hypothetical protein